MSEENKSECCSTSSGKGGCGCCGKKAVIGIIFAILLFSAGYLVAKANLCGSNSMKICPMPMQK